MSDDRVTVLLDTNVFIAAYWARSSASARLIKACIEGRVQAHYSRQVKRELVRMLRAIRIPDSYVKGLDAFWDRAKEVEAVPVDSIVVSDPDDQKFVEAAAAGGTDFLVTNDEHLLRVGYVGRTEILKPGSLCRMLGL